MKDVAEKMRSEIIYFRNIIPANIPLLKIYALNILFDYLTDNSENLINSTEFC